VAESGSFDLVTATPPYLAPGAANESTRPQVGPCRFEHRGGVEAYCRTAARLLERGGVFVTCAGRLQLRCVDAAAQGAGLRIRRRLDVVPRQGKAPLFSVYAMDRRSSRSATRFDTLIVRLANGERSGSFGALREEMGMPH
jgi:tRNA1(Val) A37 N6-methylase TrmN6